MALQTPGAQLQMATIFSSPSMLVIWWTKPDEAVALGPLQDLQDLLVGDVAAHALLHAVLGHVAHAHAELAVDLAAALAPHALLLAAGALAHGVLVVLVEPVGDVLHAHGLVLVLDGLLHGDHVHAHAAAAQGDHLGDAFEGHLGHEVEEGGQLGVLARQLIVHHPQGIEELTDFQLAHRISDLVVAFEANALRHVGIEPV